MKGLVPALLVAGLVMVLAGNSAYGTQLNIFLDPGNDVSSFKAEYLRTSSVSYGDGGALAGILNGASEELRFDPLPSDAIQVLKEKLNQKLTLDGSGVQIDRLEGTYTSILTGNQDRASVDFKLILEGSVMNYVINPEDTRTRTLVDVGWRGLTVTDPILVDGVDINSPFSAISRLSPDLGSALSGSSVEEILRDNLIDMQDVANLPLTQWHFLFDPTAINVDAGQFGLSDYFGDSVISKYTMGESSLREGAKEPVIIEDTFVSDVEYAVKVTYPLPNAELNIAGFSNYDQIEGLEILGVTDEQEGSGTSTGAFPITIVYGMAGLAAVGGGAFFVFSNRQLKKEANQGQTGIDPSRLRGYQTSASAGGYQTNRGEAQLAEESDYAQTRSVYDDAPRPDSAPPSALPQEAACGCAASAEMGNECDCQMQSACLCDAECRCASDVCREHVKSMS